MGGSSVRRVDDADVNLTATGRPKLCFDEIDELPAVSAALALRSDRQQAEVAVIAALLGVHAGRHPARRVLADEKPSLRKARAHALGVGPVAIDEEPLDDERRVDDADEIVHVDVVAGRIRRGIVVILRQDFCDGVTL